MLAIKPDEYIDYGICEIECSIDAIKTDTELSIKKLLEINKKYSEILPNINQKNNLSADANNYRNEKINMRNVLKKIQNKYAKKKNKKK